MIVLHRGKVLRMESRDGKTSIVVVLLEDRINSWSCAVIGGDNPTYRPGGYDIVLFNEDLKTAQEVLL